MTDVSRWRHEFNRFGVGSSVDGKQIRVMGLMSAQAQIRPLTLTRENALELAAWIVAIAFPHDGEFERILDHIRGKPGT